MKLQTILKPNKDICNVRELYFHEEDGFLLADGFFNLFYIEKHRIYTELDRLSLHLRLRGFQEIVLMHDRTEIRHVQLAQEREEYDIELPYSEYDDGVFWFKLKKAEQAASVQMEQAASAQAESGRNCVAADSEECVVEGYYEGTPAAAHNDVNIAVDICTYRRESYVIRNMRNVIERVFDKACIDERDKTAAVNADVSTADTGDAAEETDGNGKRPDVDDDSEHELKKHLHFMIIDNGQTLAGNAEFAELTQNEPRIKVYPNKNAGGAGGFTRGMLEVLKHNESVGNTHSTGNKAQGVPEKSAAAAPATENLQYLPVTLDNTDNNSNADHTGNAEKTTAVSKLTGTADGRFTHVLLMDDDAVFDPDIFVRLYAFFSMLKPEYSGITVGGALMREDMPQYQFASGEYYKDGLACNPYPMKDMTIYENCTSDHMLKPLAIANSYSGWWCCCFSTEIVRKDNLPLPIFIHCDDIEYGIRNQSAGIVFLNGICVWHKSAELTAPGANRYYDVRNKLITMALHAGCNAKTEAETEPEPVQKSRPEAEQKIVRETESKQEQESEPKAEQKPELSTSKALWIVLRAMTASLMHCRYAETRLAFMALEDFCRGPVWLREQDAEQLNNKLRAMVKQKKMIADLPVCMMLYIRAVHTAAARFSKAAADYRANMQDITSYDSWVKYLGLNEDDTAARV